ncbi:Cobalt-precorrin-4 C(11)-methyltransferase [Candidatus Syntrophocurvum alkaliphilum]|uniref:Cobalt-precorrin-4 C(11)-methyltransferase n=1 Tax=Candidatus Syntrophocurvum alkaliphilum TaxID=2293317 RepID=A0A6I6DDP2_9FIRM|nr:precorrin-4 C(11)-methyltransferase [Candidatus Syntrophocurvum alkaliphilum]QGU00250.1 Cobalt-precorrin-4 C(11)-methyltransferase [Candidatus Syntrophocurvum alkaliphilum]
MIYFVGAGPGDPELITVKGKNALEAADLVIYTGSLINEELLKYCRSDAELINSAGLDLVEMIDLMEKANNEGKYVVRLHTGDPSLYGAIGEQANILSQKDIPFENIPGVSSFLAAAASVKRQYTIPDGSQTVIITRIEGRTPVPEKEQLSKLAEHQASMVIFLSVSMIDNVVEELLQEYKPDTPIAVVEKASWPDERVVKGTLSNIAQLVKENQITKTALILVGEFLEKTGVSKLYSKDFEHEYRASK